MGTTTFSGPIKAGTIKETTGTTVGTDMKNTGQVVMAQTHAIDLSSGALAAVASNISVGFVGGAATALVNAYTIGTTAGRQYPTTKAGGALAWEDIGTSDQRINFTNSAATNAGECRVTILYQQNINLS